MQAVPAFHNGFLTGYKPAPIHYRPIVTKLVRIAASLILLASASMQSYAPPAPAIDYTLSQHQHKRDVSGMKYEDMTMEEIEDELMQHHDDQRVLMEKKRKLDAEIEENETYIGDYEILIKERKASQYQ